MHRLLFTQDKFLEVVVDFSCIRGPKLFGWMLILKGVTQVNSSNPIGSASKTARFGASVFVKELKKGQHLVLR